MNLSILILIPLLTAIIVLLARSRDLVKWISLAGSVVQLGASFLLLFFFNNERAAGNDSQMLFEQNFKLFSSPNINFHLGVDGISVSMILLTSFVLIAGVLVSWNIEKMTKEFYFLLILLSLGAYGFFISLDLFVLFFFLEIAVIPKYLLIGIWGSGKKEYSANKLALMLMGGSALVLVGILGLYSSDLKMTKEFYFLLILLSLGAYGFFISLDLFVLFFFLEIAVIPKYLLIGIWGSGKKEYSANKLALMLMGGSALVLVGILGLYF